MISDDVFRIRKQDAFTDNYGAVIIGYPAAGLPNRNLMTLKGNEVTWID